MIAPRQRVPNHLSHTVTKKDTAVVSEHCVSDCGFDAYARGTSSHYEILDRMALQYRIQLRLIKAAVSCLVKNNILVVRL